MRSPSRSWRRRAGVQCAGALFLSAVAASGLMTATPAIAAHPSPSAARAVISSTGCITTLPVITTVPSRYAIAYNRVLPVTVTSRGPRIRGLRVSLYTFSGDLLGRASRSSLTGSANLRLHLRYRLQAGEYTLYSEGEPNADPSCGPKHRSRVMRFRGCITRLPVTFPEPPGGTAADYGNYLSFALSSRGPLIRRLRIFVSSFEGRQYGSTRLKALFGTVTVNVPLKLRLAAGDYTITVRGSIASQPRSCGPKHAQQTLTFT
jgi:hypothetical protein